MRGVAPRQSRVGAADRARRPRRRLGPDRRDRGADALRRRRRSGGVAFSVAPGRARRAFAPRSRRAADRGRLRPRRIGARQARRARTQLFQRRRSRRSLRFARPPRFPRASSRRRCSCAWSRRSFACCRSAPPDGYAFRVDLRLRPDPASTPIAVSLAGAGVYYETLGQNWERAAMIKARAAAGDLELGRRFPRRSRAVHLAQVFRLRGDRRHSRDEAPDPRGARPRARSRSPATTSSSAAAASARSNSSSRRSN